MTAFTVSRRTSITKMLEDALKVQSATAKNAVKIDTASTVVPKDSGDSQHGANLSDAQKLVALKKLLPCDDMMRFKMILATIDDKSALGDIFTDACCMGKDAYIKLMIDFGVDVNIRCRNGNHFTGLIFAARYGQETTVRLLLAHGADTSLEDIDCNSAWYCCINVPILNMLNAAMSQEHAKASQEDAKASQEDTEASQEDTVRGEPSDDGRRRDFRDAINILIADMDEGAKLHMLTAFIAMDDLSKVEIVLQSIQDKSILGDVFIDACRTYKPNLVKLMIDFGVDVNIRDKRHGSTGLMFAAQSGNLSIVELLLAHGADALLQGASKLTAKQFSRHLAINKILDDAEKVQREIKIRAKIEPLVGMKLCDGELICKKMPNGDEVFVTHIDNGCQVYFKEQKCDDIILL